MKLITQLLLLLLCVRAPAAFIPFYSLNTYAPVTAATVTSMVGATNQDVVLAVDGAMLVLTNDGAGHLGSNSAVTVSGQPVAMASAAFQPQATPGVLCASFGANTLSLFTNIAGLNVSTVYSTNSTLGTNFAYVTNSNYTTNLNLGTNRTYYYYWFGRTTNFSYYTNSVAYATNFSYSTNSAGTYTNLSITSTNTATLSGRSTFGLGYTLSSGLQPSHITAGMVDGTTNTGAVCANAGDNTILVLTNKGNGTLSPWKLLSTVSSYGVITLSTNMLTMTIQSFTPGHYTTNYLTNSVYWTNNTAFTNFSINLLGTNWSTYSTNLSGAITNGFGPVNTALVNLSSPSLYDIITANEQDGSMSWFTNSAGTNGFALCQNYAVGVNPIAVRVVTNSATSAIEIVVADAGTNVLYVYMATNHAPVFVSSALVGDFTRSMTVIGNGTPNIELACSTSTNGIVLMTNNAANGFTRAGNFAVSSLPRKLISSDLTHSGYRSILAVNSVTPSTQPVVNLGVTNYVVVFSNSITVYTNDTKWP